MTCACSGRLQCNFVIFLTAMSCLWVSPPRFLTGELSALIVLLNEGKRCDSMIPANEREPERIKVSFADGYYRFSPCDILKISVHRLPEASVLLETAVSSSIFGKRENKQKCTLRNFVKPCGGMLNHILDAKSFFFSQKPFANVNGLYRVSTSRSSWFIPLVLCVCVWRGGAKGHFFI